MHAFEWNSQLDTGFEQLDLEHKEVFQSIVDCAVLARSGASKEELIAPLNAIFEKLDKHFYSEECMAERAARQHKDLHKAQHDALLKGLELEISSFANGSDSNITAEEIVNNLFDWYLTHIKNEDVKLVQQTKSNIVANLMKSSHSI